MQTNGQYETGKIKNIYLENLGTVNKNKVTIQTEKGYIDLFFSYKTLVGFSVAKEGHLPTTKCMKNYWSVTTGKLLNDIEPNHKNRLDSEQFNEELNKAFREIGLNENIKVGC